MSYREGTYVIALGSNGKKKHLLKVTTVTDQELQGVDHLLMPTPDGSVPYVTVPLSAVLADLGPLPLLGTAYGVYVEPFWRTFDSGLHGRPAHCWRRLKKAEWEALRAQVDLAFERLEKKGIRLTHPLEWHVRNPRGPYAGWYKALRGKGDEVPPDIICFMPPSFSENPRDRAMVQLICHELGHAVWYRNMRPGQRAAWVRAYIEASALQETRETRIKQIAKVIREGQPQSVRELWALFEFEGDGEQEISREDVQAILDHVMVNRNLRPPHLDLLLAASVDITPYFSRHALDRGELGELLTDYSRKAPEEMFAEAFSLWVTGHTLPQKWVKLLERTTR